MPYSNCCGAYTYMEEYGICPDCKEQCDFVENENDRFEDDTVVLPAIQAIKNTDTLFSSLAYGSYKANRGYGMTHEQLVRIGIGNDDFKQKYENQ